MITQEMKRTLFKALKEAGNLMRTSFAKRRVIKKKSELSIVTEVDLLAEKRILRIIRKKFPKHSILTEESPAQDRSPQRWIIDPVDGTTNFAHGFPAACVSIAYEDSGEVLLGGVYDPFRNELFFAQKGKGAFMNNKRIKVSETRALSNALLATGFPYDRRERADEYLAVFKAFMMKVQGLRRMGAAAIDLCHVACGRFDGYWESKLNPWDVAAGTLIVKEAGGKISDYSGSKYSIHADHTAASNGLIHSQMLAVLKRSNKKSA